MAWKGYRGQRIAAESEENPIPTEQHPDELQAGGPLTAGGPAAMHTALDHWARVYAFARHLSGDPSRAEDLAQEAYLRLADAAPGLDLARPLLPWLLTTVRNLARSEARRRAPDSLELHAAGPDAVPDGADGDPARELLRRESVDAVRAALAGLRPTWRAALFLRDGLELSYREVAAILELSEDVVRVTLHRARARVRAVLASVVNEEPLP